MNTRNIYLDNLKLFLTVLVILHHSAGVAGLDPMGFNLPNVSSQYQDQYQYLDYFQGCNQSYFMGLFFFISGLFVVPSLRHKGRKRFFIDKLKRLGLPTLLFPLIIFPAILYTDAIKNLADFFQNGNINLGVTWFCWTLIVFCAIWLCLQPKLDQPSNKPLPSLLKITTIGLITVPVNFLAYHLQSIVGENFLGFHLIKYFTMYILMFAAGIVAYRNNWLEQIKFKHAFYGIVTWYFARQIIGYSLGSIGINSEMVFYGFTSIGMSLFLLYSFKKLFNKQGQTIALLTRAAYAAYVFQIIFLYISAKLFQAHMTEIPLVNFIIIAIPSVSLSFLFGIMICKAPILKKIF